MMRSMTLLAVATLPLAACDHPPALAPADGPQLLIGGSPSSPHELTYVKTETGAGTAHWTGTVAGDISGDLRTQVLGVRVAGHLWHLETRWQVDAGAQSFVAELDGTLDTRTGKLLLLGPIVSGYLAGAQVYDDGQLTGFDAGTGGTVFEGRLRITTASAH